MPAFDGAAADALRAALVGSREVLLTGPVGPDGDSLGACLALGWALRTEGVSVTLAGSVPRRYEGLVPDGAFVPDAALAGRYDAVVVLDGDRTRLEPRTEAAFGAARVRGLVDHHRSTVLDGYTHPWLEPTTESTCTMVLRALERWGLDPDREVASWLYMGLVFDTGGFRHTNTRPTTHHAAARLLATGIDHARIHTRVLAERSRGGMRAMGEVLGAARVSGRFTMGAASWALQERHALSEGDLEGVVEALLYTEGTEVAALLVERADGSVKVSLRSRSDTDVAAVARRLTPTGGGHPRASGAHLFLPLDAVAERVASMLAALDPTAGGDPAPATPAPKIPGAPA